MPNKYKSLNDALRLAYVKMNGTSPNPEHAPYANNKSKPLKQRVLEAVESGYTSVDEINDCVKAKNPRRVHDALEQLRSEGKIEAGPIPLQLWRSWADDIAPVKSGVKYGDGHRRLRIVRMIDRERRRTQRFRHRLVNVVDRLTDMNDESLSDDWNRALQFAIDKIKRIMIIDDEENA